MALRQLADAVQPGGAPMSKRHLVNLDFGQ
jgi:hypothetical protein